MQKFRILLLTTLLVSLSTASPRPLKTGSSSCKGSECNGRLQTLSIREIKCRSADCPGGYRHKGDNCYRPYHSYTSWSKTASCPSGYTNMGLTCYRGPHSYTKCCTTIWSKCRCRDGYTNMGCHCQRWAKTLTSGHMSCPDGYFLNKELGRCYDKCRQGYSNKGEYCARPSSTLADGHMTCKSDVAKFGDRCCPSECKKPGIYPTCK